MDETAIAFESPQVRAAATAGPDPLDRISVRDYVRDIDIGAFQSERGRRQRVRFNVVLEVSHTTAAESDDVDKVISYDTIVEAIEERLSTERINLLETLAERIAETCLADMRVIRAFVRIEKLDRIPGTLGVEIVRSQRAMDVAHPIRPVSRQPEPVQHPHPLVVFLSNDVLHGPHLKSWLDAIASNETPAIICVERTVEESAHARHPMADRRIGLLSIEQNAWVLAGMDKRCVVVDSRTELDWAVKHGQLSVWAPSKVVLNAVHPPRYGAEAPVELARWLAVEFDASRLAVVGAHADTLPGEPAFPTVFLGPDDAERLG